MTGGKIPPFTGMTRGKSGMTVGDGIATEYLAMTGESDLSYL
jgi:hypothetical protein